MLIHIYIYIYICTYTPTPTHTDLTQTWACRQLHVHKHTETDTCKCTGTQYINLCTYMQLHILHTCICTYTQTYVLIWKCTYWWSFLYTFFNTKIFCIPISWYTKHILLFDMHMFLICLYWDKYNNICM